MMSSAFDRYDKSYARVVQDSIAFSGLKHDFFLEAKVVKLQALFARHFKGRKPALADIGCGIGALHPLLSPLCASIAGCDPSADCIEQAKAANAGIDYRSAQGQNLPWASHAFDVALAVCVFHHVVPGERAALVAEMRRIVRPGGLVVVIEHNPWNPGTRMAVARCPFDHDAELLDWRQCAAMLAQGGLTNPTSEHFLLLPFGGSVPARIEKSLQGMPLGAQYLTAGLVP